MYQHKIIELTKNSQEFISEEMNKKADGKSDDFGTSVNESMLKKEAEIGFKKKLNKSYHSFSFKLKPLKNGNFHFI